MVKYLSKSTLLTNITEPLNENRISYYGVMNDGSSSTKTMDEKELFVIKTAATGVPKFSVMSLEDVADANAEGLKTALENLVGKLNLTVQCKDKELGLCTDGAPVNVKMHRLVKEEIGEHYQLILCPAHKIELAMHDAFKKLQINTDVEKDCINIYYFFKRANLKWRLFKRQSEFMNIPLVRYKRPTGTRWVEHQVDALDSTLKNLPIFLGFANVQITNPYNKQMKDAKARLQGYLKDNSQIVRIVSNCIKKDILTTLQPVSKVLQDSELILPQLITIASTGIKTIKKVSKLIEREREEAFKKPDIFPTVCKFIDELHTDPSNIFPERQSESRSPCH